MRPLQSLRVSGLMNGDCHDFARRVLIGAVASERCVLGACAGGAKALSDAAGGAKALSDADLAGGVGRVRGVVVADLVEVMIGGNTLSGDSCSPAIQGRVEDG